MDGMAEVSVSLLGLSERWRAGCEHFAHTGDLSDNDLECPFLQWHGTV